MNQKKGIVMGMTNKAVLLSDPKFHQKNIKFIINILIKNDYPVLFIFEISKKLKYLFSKRNSTDTEMDNSNDNKNNLEKDPWFLLLYNSTI